MKASELRLRRALEQNHALAGVIPHAGAERARLEFLQGWQRQRLAKSYEDLLAQRQFREAGHFFLDELYGGLGFVERDRQVARVLPVMTRVLSDHMLDAMARAFELQALSIALDLDMAASLAEPVLDEPAYAAIYRQVARFPERRQQIELIAELGHELNELVRHPMVLKLIRALRLPARMAGFGQLQDFLEEGLRAFSAMRDGEYFVETIHARESRYLQRIREGADFPFSEGPGFG